MVSSLMKTLLLQGFIIIRVKAESIGSILAGAEDVLRDLLVKEKKELCGSTEIHTLLSDVPSKSNNRVALWGKIDKIAETKLTELDKLISETQARLEEAQEELAQKKGEEKPEMESEFIKQFLMKALFAGGFDPASEDQAVANAKMSACRMLSPRKCKKINPLCIITKEAYDDSISKFSELITVRMQANDVRIQGNAINAACQEMLAGEEPTYCDQMCVKMSQEGARISDEAVGQTAGASSAELQAKVDALLELLKKYTIQNTKCKEGTEALKAFKMTLAPLEAAIKTTFDAWFKANRDLEEAEETLEDLQADMEESEALCDQLEELLKSATEKLTDAEDALKLVKKSEVFLKLKLNVAQNVLAEAKAAMEKNDDALKAAELIKEKVAGIIEKLTALYDFFVKEPIRNMMLDEPTTLDVFDAISGEESAAAVKFKESMTALSGHCKDVAMPAFSKIDSIDLTPLCSFGGDDAGEGVVSMVAARKGEVKDELTKFKSWWKDFDVEVEEKNEVSEPVLLGEVMEAFPQPDFASVYMAKWKTDGPFLKAIEELRMAIKELTGTIGKAEEKISGLADSLKKNIQFRLAARLKIQEAVDQKKIAEDKLQAASEVLAQQEEAENEQTQNVDRLKAIAEAALQEYKKALDAFQKVFIAGTRIDLDLLQQKQETHMKPIKRVM